MAARLILNTAKSPLGYLLRSSALSSVRIAAGPKPLAGADALRRGIFDSEAQKRAGVRLWGLNSDPLDLKLAAARGGGPKKSVEVEEVKKEEYDSNADSGYSDEENITDFEDTDADYYDSPSEGGGSDDDDA